MTLNDDIHDWISSLPAWQQELFLRALPGRELGEASLDEVLSIALGEQKSVAAGRTVRRDDLPADLGADVSLQLLAIEHHAGVNQLPAGEELPLIPRGLNVVYGPNGGGKSGWARIPKHAGRARHEERILGDVFAPEGSRPRPRAEIRWQLAGSERRTVLALDEPAPADLAGMCVFDASCGLRLLTEDHQVDYVPLALEALERLGQAQLALANRAATRIADLRDAPLDLDPYPEGTEVRRLLALSADTDLAALQDLATITAADDERAETLTQQVAEIDARQGDRLATAAERDGKQVDALAVAIAAIAAHVGEDALAAAHAEAAAVRAAEEAAARLSTARFASEPLGGAATEPWLVMWRAVQAFMRDVHGQPFPPEHDPAHCPTCMQVLTPDARARLARFDEWVRSDVEQQLAHARAVQRRRVDALPDPGRAKEVHSAAIAALAEDDAAAARAVTAWFDDAAIAVGALRDGRLDGLSPLPAPPAGSLEAFALARHETAARHRRLADREEEARLRSQLAELRARTALAARWGEIEARVRRMREVAALEHVRGQFGTGALSRKQRDLASGFVTGRLEEELRGQLRNLNFEHVEIVGCRTSGRQGRPHVGVKLKAVGDVPLRGVLSEGEQRRIALAFFLAEVSVAYSGQPIVLDDPVCSIDHQGRRHIARTLARLARERQVVVFTHELTFLHELETAAKREQIELFAQYVMRAGGRAGRVQSQLPWGGRTAQQRRSDLNRVHQDLAALYRRVPDGDEYQQGAAEFAWSLRQAFERAVEDEVLGGVVTRGDPGVHLQQLRKVAWSEEICRLSDLGLDEASPWVHDPSRALNPMPPTPDELGEGLGVLSALLKAVEDLRTARKQKAAGMRSIPGVADGPPPETDGEVRQLPGLSGAA